MRGINTEFLDFDEDVMNQVCDKYEIEEFAAWVRFWSNEEIQIDGNLSLKEMQALTEIMQAVNLDVQQRLDELERGLLKMDSAFKTNPLTGDKTVMAIVKTLLDGRQ